MEYVITVAKKDVDGERQVYQQVMGEEFKLKRLILALNSQRKTGTKKEDTR